MGKIDFTCDTIEPGDYLETFAEPGLPERTADMAEPKFSDRARVLFGTDRRANLGDGDRSHSTAAAIRASHSAIALPSTAIVTTERRSSMSPTRSCWTWPRRRRKAVLVMVRDAVLTGDLAFLRR